MPKQRYLNASGQWAHQFKSSGSEWNSNQFNRVTDDHQYFVFLLGANCAEEEKSFFRHCTPSGGSYRTSTVQPSPDDAQIAQPRKFSAEMRTSQLFAACLCHSRMCY